MSDLIPDMLKNAIEDIKETIKEAKVVPNDAYNEGQLIAYNYVLSILKRNLTPFEKEFGLNFDIDKWIYSSGKDN